VFLECGFLTEREDDTQFGESIQSILEVINQYWKNNPHNDKGFFKPFELYVLIISDEHQDDAYAYFTKTKKDKMPCIVINAYYVDNVAYKNKNFLEIINKSQDILYHELVHYVNYISAQDGNRLIQRGIYYTSNSGQEFNAYYHQIRKKFVDIVKQLKKDNEPFEVIGDNTQQFIKKFWHITKMLHPTLEDKINSHYRKKWLKRIYQLYFELRELYYKEI
jgi:hypothetical protein